MSAPLVFDPRCDLCKDWMKREGKSVPACVEACPVHARSVVQIG